MFFFLFHHSFPYVNPQQTVYYQVLVRCSRRAACLDVEALLHEAHLRRELLVHGRREAPERRVERVRRGPAREAQSLHGLLTTNATEVAVSDFEGNLGTIGVSQFSCETGYHTVL